MNKKIFLLFIIPFVISCATTPKSTQESIQKSPYTIIIDAGSTGSRLFVYKIEQNRNSDLPNIISMNPNDDIGKVEPGISDFENNPTQGANNIITLLNRAKEIIEPKYRKQTPIYVLATAGMRLKNKTERENIFKKVVNVIDKDNTFKSKAAITISGRYEGLYGWLAINYLDDKFDTKQQREGLLEMGGSSTQISFVPDSDFKDYKLQRKIKGKVYDIYSRSFLKLGTNQVKELVFSADCYLKNSSQNGKNGTGNCDKCLINIMDKFSKTCNDNSSTNCHLYKPHCVFSLANIPHTNDDFIAVSGFYYSLKFLKLENNINLETLYEKAVELCASDYNKLEYNYGETPNKYNKDYCLLSSYYYLLFKIGYQMPTDSKISISENDVSWTLGAALDIASGYTPEIYMEN